MMLWDPLRNKAVTATPEESVRQWFIRMLTHVALIPEKLMMSEVPMKYGGKSWRADIVVYGRDGKPLAIAECKRPETGLDASVAEQALRYSAVLSVNCIMLTNRDKTYIYRRVGDSFKQVDHLPEYSELMSWQG